MIGLLRQSRPRFVVLVGLLVLTVSGCAAATPSSVPPTGTSTWTSLPPTATLVPPTATSVPPTAALVSPTATPVPPKAALVPATATSVPPTKTPEPTTATVARTATEEATATANAGPTPGSETPNASSALLCLGCHGPFDKLINAQIEFTTSGDETLNPHRFVPHDSKNVPQCTKCHVPHPIPLKSTDTVPEANVEWCFSCHHQWTFTPCKECHD